MLITGNLSHSYSPKANATAKPSAAPESDTYTPKYAEDFGQNDLMIYGGGAAASVAGTAALANTFLPDGGLVGTLVGSAVGGLVGAVHGSGDDLFLHDTRKDFATVRRGAVGAWIGAASGIAGAVVGSLLGSGSAGAIVGSVVGGVVSHKVNEAWFDRRADEYEQFRQWRDR